MCQVALRFQGIVADLFQFLNYLPNKANGPIFPRNSYCYICSKWQVQKIGDLKVDLASIIHLAISNINQRNFAFFNNCSVFKCFIFNPHITRLVILKAWLMGIQIVRSSQNCIKQQLS